MKDRNLNFLCIGAQKAGTTWLYQVLKEHPQIQLPPVKELHFFDEAESKNSQILIRKLFVNNKFNRVWRRHLFRGVIKSILRGRFSDILWCIRFSAIPRTFDEANLKNYDRLFQANNPEIVSGEITPGYSILTKTSISKISTFFPKLKILFILRDPVERTWSQIKMGIKRKGSSEFTFEKIMEFIDRDNLRSDYPRTIQNWGEFFPKEQIFYGFYDDLAHDPQTFMKSVYDFLEVNQMTTQKDGRKSNVGLNLKIDDKIRDKLVARYREDCRWLSVFFRNAEGQNHPEKWLKHYEAEHAQGDGSGKI